ncbi:hypothetical protein PaeBR_18020 [Paenibacillus sp. BR2-3]|uniref:hypothetical protein n=1 Tax=Paenibacillus sp. BR2-3 TaxID=3048494 RepID=UPI003977A430
MVEKKHCENQSSFAKKDSTIVCPGPQAGCNSGHYSIQTKNKSSPNSGFTQAFRLSSLPHPTPSPPAQFSIIQGFGEMFGTDVRLERGWQNIFGWNQKNIA